METQGSPGKEGFFGAEKNYVSVLCFKNRRVSYIDLGGRESILKRAEKRSYEMGIFSGSAEVKHKT